MSDRLARLRTYDYVNLAFNVPALAATLVAFVGLVSGSSYSWPMFLLAALLLTWKENRELRRRIDEHARQLAQWREF